jgi:hypothetical protein
MSDDDLFSRRRLRLAPFAPELTPPTAEAMEASFDRDADLRAARAAAGLDAPWRRCPACDRWTLTVLAAPDRCAACDPPLPPAA